LLNISANAASYAGPALGSQLQPGSSGEIAVSPCGGNIPAVTLLNSGTSVYIQLTFTDCSPTCNSWTLQYWQVVPSGHAAGDTGMRTITVDCSHLPDMALLPLHPVAIPHSFFGYQYQLSNCCGWVTNIKMVE